MAIVVQDVLESAQLKWTPKGIEVSRCFIVSGLTGDPCERLFNATQADLPKFGDFHPTRPGIRVLDVAVTPIDVSTCRVVVSYQGVDPKSSPPDDKQKPIIEVGAQTVQVETNEDIDGNLLTTHFIQTKLDPVTSLQKTYDETQPGKIQIQVPQPIVKLSRREQSNPYDKALMYVGKINAQSFMDQASHMWMCIRIIGRSDDGGRSYNVDYEFQFNRESWDPTIVGIDKDTGMPPVDTDGNSVLVEGDGFKQVQVYEEVDFAGLSL